MMKQHTLVPTYLDITSYSAPSPCAAQEPMCGPANHRNGWLLTQLTASARNRDDWHSDSLVSPVKSRCDAAVKTQHFSSCFLACL